MSVEWNFKNPYKHRGSLGIVVSVGLSEARGNFVYTHTNKNLGTFIVRNYSFNFSPYYKGVKKFMNKSIYRGGLTLRLGCQNGVAFETFSPLLVNTSDILPSPDTIQKLCLSKHCLT